MGMVLITFGEERGAQENPSAGGSSVGEETFVREGVSLRDIPEGNGVDVSDDKMEEARDSDSRRYSFLVWLSNLQEATNDLPVIPSGYIIRRRDFLERGWGWQRLVPYSRVEWANYKRYLEEYFIHNAGEVAALCASRQPYQGGQGIDSGCNDQQAAAKLFLDVDNDFIRICRDVLTPEDISLSHEIGERAKHMIQAKGDSSVAASALVCMAEEAELMCHLLDYQFDTTKMINFSNMVRRWPLILCSAKGLNLMLPLLQCWVL